MQNYNLCSFIQFMYLFCCFEECLYGNVLSKLQMHNCTLAKHAKTCKCSLHWSLQDQSSEKKKTSAYDAHIQQQ